MGFFFVCSVNAIRLDRLFGLSILGWIVGQEGGQDTFFLVELGLRGELDNFLSELCRKIHDDTTQDYEDDTSNYCSIDNGCGLALDCLELIQWLQKLSFQSKGIL